MRTGVDARLSDEEGKNLSSEKKGLSPKIVGGAFFCLFLLMAWPALAQGLLETSLATPEGTQAGTGEPGYALPTVPKPAEGETVEPGFPPPSSPATTSSAPASPAPSPSAAPQVAASAASAPLSSDPVPVSVSLPTLGSAEGKREAPSVPSVGEESIAGGGVPASVKKAIKKLDGAAEHLTLEDLNAAREAVAKLDVLLDIEKRLSDLARIREERNEAGNLAAALPDTALPMPSPMTERDVAPMPFPARKTEFEKPDVVRIFGSGGSYVAICKMPSGEEVQVQKGDELGDGSLVTAISAKGVTLAREGRSVVLRVKDISHIHEEPSSSLPSLGGAPVVR